MTGKTKSPSGVMVQQIAYYLMTGKTKSPSGVMVQHFVYHFMTENRIFPLGAFCTTIFPSKIVTVLL